MSLHDENRPKIRLLGDLEITRGKQRQALPASKKSRALLAYLVATARPHLRESLCDLLWEGPDDPRAGLRWSMTKIRPVLGCDGVERLIADRERVSFETRGATVDVHQLRAAIPTGVRDADVPALCEAASTLRGGFLDGLDMSAYPAFHAWCTAERERLRSLRVAVLEALVARLHDAPSEALPHARALVMLDPIAEGPRIVTMRLLAELGQHEQALVEYTDFCRTLERELGAEPSAELVALRSSLRRGVGVAPAKRAPTAPVPAATTAPFVGRTAQRERLRRIAGDALGGESRLLLVLGEAGAGKSRLLEELGTDVRAAGGRVLAGRSFEPELVRPYGAFIEALRGAGLDEVTEILESKAVPSFAPGTAEKDRARLFEGVARTLAEAARAAPPLLLVFDDLQWIDEASAALLHYLARGLRGAPALLAASARTGELADNAAAVRLVRALERERRIEGLEVGPLARDEVFALVRAIDGGADAERVFAESGGNPLFVIEVTRALGAGATNLADSLAAVVADRLGRFDGPRRVILAFAAALGRSFDVDVLRRTSGLAGTELLEALAELERHAVLRASGASGYDFTHDLLRAAAYQQVSEPRRRIIHAQIARALDGLHDPDASLAGDVARHAALGGEQLLAARASLKAVERCLRLFAYADASDLGERALRLLSGLPAQERLPIQVELLGLEIHCQRRGAAAERDAAFERAAAEAREAGLPAVEARAFYFRSLVQYLSGDSSGAAETSRLRVETQQQSPEQRAHELAGAGLCLALLQKEMEKVESLVADAETILGPGVEKLEVSLARGLLHHFHGELDPAAGHLERALALARQRRADWEECECLRELALVEIERERFDEALAYANVLSSVAGKIGEGAEKPTADALSALADLRMGRSQSTAALDEAVAALRRADSMAMSARVLVLAAELRGARGEHAAARACATEALEAARAVDRASDLAEAQAVLAEVAAQQGDRAAALAHLGDVAAFLELPDALSARARAAVTRARATVQRVDSNAADNG